MNKESYFKTQDAKLEKVKQRIGQGFYFKREVVTVVAEKLLKKILANKVKP